MLAILCHHSLPLRRFCLLHKPAGCRMGDAPNIRLWIYSRPMYIGPYKAPISWMSICPSRSVLSTQIVSGFPGLQTTVFHITVHQEAFKWRCWGLNLPTLTLNHWATTLLSNITFRRGWKVSLYADKLPLIVLIRCSLVQRQFYINAGALGPMPSRGHLHPASPKLWSCW